MYRGDLVREISYVALQKDCRPHVDNLTGILDRMVGSSLRRVSVHHCSAHIGPHWAAVVN
jgi:hypothetical protein